VEPPSGVSETAEPERTTKRGPMIKEKSGRDLGRKHGWRAKEDCAEVGDVGAGVAYLQQRLRAQSSDPVPGNFPVVDQDSHPRT
jgi:hypothetical protein